MGELIIIDREVLLGELQKVFDKNTASTLLGVLEKVTAQIRSSSVTRDDFADLKRIMSEIAESQRKSEERFARIESVIEEIIQVQKLTEGELKELAATQKKTEAIVKELGEAQKRTEARVEELVEAQKRTEAIVKELGEAQKRTEARVEELAEAQKGTEKGIDDLVVSISLLRKQVGGLSETVGGDIEDIAYIVLYDVLKREYGWELGKLERTWVNWDNQAEEINIFGKVTDPASKRDIWIIGEAKHSLSLREVARFIKQVDRAKKHLIGIVFPVCFCYRAHPDVQKRVYDAGINLVFSYGKIVPGKK